MKTRNWTVEEDSILKDDYNMFGPEICRAELSKAGFDRTSSSIKNRAQSLGLYYRQEYSSWTQDQIRILRENYPAMGKKVMSLLPDKSLKSIQITAYRMGIKKAKKN